MEQCAVCMDTVDEAGGHALACGHVFHVDCILNWARSDNDAHARCPVCRELPEGGAQLEFHYAGTGYGVVNNTQRFERAARALECAAEDFDDSERQLYSLLRRECDKAAAAEAKTRKEHESFRREHRATLARERVLRSRTWAKRHRVHSVRRDLLTLFPVTHVIVRRDRGRGGSAQIVRRSARLAEARDATDDRQV
tara:strand:+ start:919 stop:1506 length:588 start_codon:yes stop_codon:yes gene_type:complete